MAGFHDDDSPAFELLAPEALPTGEASEARSYWAERGVRAMYVANTHWGEHMAEQVLAYEPRRVLEFGCNAGRNLRHIAARDPGVELVGIDVNADAVEHGRREFGLDLRVGDEASLAEMSDNSFDVAFTVSVLDHLPDPRPALGALLRLAGRAVLLLEPWLGGEGRVVRNTRIDTGELVDTTPYSYSWDYAVLLAGLAPDRVLRRSPYQLSGTNLGRYYELYSVEPVVTLPLACEPSSSATRSE